MIVSKARRHNVSSSLNRPTITKVSPTTANVIRRANSTSNSNGRRRRSRQGPRADATSYSGPITLPLSDENAHLVPVNFGIMVVATTDGAGLLAGMYSSEGFKTCADWASIAACFDEYRCVGFSLEFVWHRRFDTTSLWMPWVTYLDRADNSTPSSYNISANAESAKAHSPFEPIRRTIKMKSVEEAEFYDINASPNAWGYIKFYSSNNSATFTLGYFHVKYLVQFRGRV